MKPYIAVRVDDENNADEWWGALREKYPAFAASLEKNGAAVIKDTLWDALTMLPGFADGPEYAKYALIDCGGEGPMWADVTAGRHAVYEYLS
jgi:hypothetical protein